VFTDPPSLEVYPPYPGTWQEFCSWFGDEQFCVAYLEQLRWATGFRCPKCEQDAGCPRSGFSDLGYHNTQHVCHPERPERSEGSRRTCGCFFVLSQSHMSGCPILAAYLFLRLGWDSTNLNHPRFERARFQPRHPPSTSFYKSTHATKSRHQLKQPERRYTKQKTNAESISELLAHHLSETIR
jgi:hypothetical protein